MSFQAGLPSMLGSQKYDTLEPRSLRNSELHEGMTELPPSRPKTEQTPVSYMLSKGKLIRLLGEIGDFLLSLDTYSYDKILEFDDRLILCHSELPPFLQIGSLDNAATRLHFSSMEQFSWNFCTMKECVFSTANSWQRADTTGGSNDRVRSVSNPPWRCCRFKSSSTMMQSFQMESCVSLNTGIASLSRVKLSS